MTKIISAITIALAATSGLAAAQDDGIDSIIGGTQVSGDKYPWLASLQSTSGSHFCGSSLITSNLVLTAAHCVSSGATNFRVRLGTSDLNSNRGVVATPSRVYVHPSYNGNTLMNDIAIIQLSSPVSGITPVSLDLSSSNSQLQSGTATVAGWGLTSGSATSTPRQLREVSVPIVADTTCDNSSPFNTYLDAASMVCIGTANGSRTSCRGDSGGPMFKGTTQIGLTSWGNTSCSSYAVYTQIPYFASWIRSVANGRAAADIDAGELGAPAADELMDVEPMSCGCVGTGTDVGSSCGNWLNAGFNWCYTDASCAGAEKSLRYNELSWTECTPSRFDTAVQFESFAMNHHEATVPGTENFFKVAKGAAVPAAAAGDNSNMNLLVGAAMGAGIAGVAAGTVFMVYKKQRDAAVDAAIDRVEAERSMSVKV